MQAILSKVRWPLPILDVPQYQWALRKVMELQFKLSQLAFEQTKELIVLNPPNSLKLFLTMETNTSKCLTPVTNPNEPLPGNRANLVDCLRSIFLARLSSGPNEKAQICFLLAW
ncbi:hypothetical protein PPACK8108_LOCUS25815 [Phakopsora pachyrhizi]|uniref:Uncharacterized protein n=1 Tax=Phakopsora pachyrhizi TaxID=170000 RepID=A0AAV0BSP0_PHAPC|nr:hypothetical protein PPACK8108_LOCUS25815 [Phakopsora pachyrhizi]